MNEKGKHLNQGSLDPARTNPSTKTFVFVRFSMAVIKYLAKATYGKMDFFGLLSEVKSHMDKTEQQEPFLVRKKRYINAYTQFSFPFEKIQDPTLVTLLLTVFYATKRHHD